PAQFRFGIDTERGLFQHGRIHIRRQDLEIPPPQFRPGVEQCKRDGVGLLSGRTARRPYPELLPGGAGAGGHHLADMTDQMLKMMVFAVEAGEVCRQRDNELLRVFGRAGVLEIVEIIVEGAQLQLPDDLGQPRYDQRAFGLAERYARLRMDPRLDPRELAIAQRKLALLHYLLTLLLTASAGMTSGGRRCGSSSAFAAASPSLAALPPASVMASRPSASAFDTMPVSLLRFSKWSPMPASIFCSRSTSSSPSCAWLRLPPTRSRSPFADCCADRARPRTSSATTAKPAPFSPARAASTAALSASRLVRKLTSSMAATMASISAPAASTSAAAICARC